MSQFDQSFSNWVVQNVGRAQRYVDNWVEGNQMELVTLLRELYKPEIVINYGLVHMKSFLQDAILKKGKKDTGFLLFVAYLLVSNFQVKLLKPILILDYVTIDGKVIAVTDFSLLQNANFKPEFYQQVKSILQP